MNILPKKSSEIDNNTINAFKKALGVNVLSNLIIVDAINGSDEFAVSNISIPYKSLTAAKNVALFGNTILVLPGVYLDYDLLKNGVNWIFINGSKIQITTEVSINIFDDSDESKVCTIDGNLEIDIICNSVESIDSTIISIVNDSTVSIKLKSFSIVNAVGISDAITAIKVSNGNLFWSANYVTSGRVIQEMQGGSVKCNARIINGGYGFVTENGTLICEIDIANISDVVIYSGGAGHDQYGGDVFATIKRSMGGIVFYHNNGKVTGEVGFVAGMLTSSGPYATMYITCDEIICNSGQTPLNVDGGNIFIDVNKITTNQQIASCGGGNINISVRDAKTSFAGVGIPIIANANVTLKGRFETTTENPLFLNIVGNLILDSAKLIVPITQNNSVIGTQTILSYNSFSNKPVANETTVNGTLTVASYVN